MALFVDSAYLDDITNVAQSVPLAGVTTNPTILLAARESGQKLDPLGLLATLLQRLEGLIFMQPGATTEEEMFGEAVTFIETSPDRIIPKIPMTQIGMRVALRLKQREHKIAFTAVTTVAQAYSAAMAGADFVIPYFNRLIRAGVDASEQIAQMADLFHNQKISTRILVASIKSPQEAEAALLAGAHDLTIAPAILLDMLIDVQSEKAVERFTQDWERMKTL